MGLSALWRRSSAAKYARAIKKAPRHVIINRQLWSSALLYALAGFPMTWEQGASAVIPTLPGFQKQFNVASGNEAGDIATYVTIIYIGYAIGSALSFFVNDYLGRRWSFRLYSSVLIIGQIISIFAPNMNGLIGGRIVTGMGIGSLSVIGPMSIVEISPKEIRGVLTSWYTVSMGISLTLASFAVLGIHKTVPDSKLQYQITPTVISVFLFLCIVASFFVAESPRWLLMVGRREEAVATLVKLRCMPADSERVAQEIADIEASVISANGDVEGKPALWTVAKETFTVSSNLRRLQQVLVSYALAQLSGANSVTSYFIPIMELLGYDGGTERRIFLSGMYGFSKLWFSLISAFFFIDILGRRVSLFIGITIQMLSHLYIGVYIKYHQEGEVSDAAGQCAIAMIFFHALGYAVGLFILPYVFGGELWPTRIRSFGGAVGQTFHWLFIYAVKFSVPDMLASMDNWGAFFFFAGWCFLGLIYVYLMVPEIAGLSVEEVDKIFEGPWLNAIRTSRHKHTIDAIEPGKPDHDDLVSPSHS